ncbi:hypothetical protein FRB99_004902 [Tulasnella sp. 403]|nr:hypothetical protein FRB99_004902 [Tulasnella sp. 403]
MTIKNEARTRRYELKRQAKVAQNRVKKKLLMERKALEAKNPELKRKRLAENPRRTVDNMREYDPALVNLPSDIHPASSTYKALHKAPTTSTSDPSSSKSNAGESMDSEHAEDIANDPFAEYFDNERDPTVPPKVLITTSPFATKISFEFCEELAGIFPGAEYIKRRKRGIRVKIPALGTLAQWTAKRGYSSLIVVNEDHGKPNAITIIHLPSGPTAYFRLSSVQLSKEILGHGVPSPHHPELILNGFVTRLGHAVGRMFQTLFPPMPEFEGRQVVTLHNQRDFLFFRRHRYMFKSTDSTALQEIGPRFTLKLRSLKTGLPVTQNLAAPAKPLELAKDDDIDQEGEEPEQIEPEVDDDDDDNDGDEKESSHPSPKKPVRGPKDSKAEEFAWIWKSKMQRNKRTFFL